MGLLQICEDSMKYIYIAGPYSKSDPVINTSDAIRVGDYLAKRDFIPFIPHLTLFWHLIKPHDVNFWYEYDNAWLRKCDCLLRIPGKSVGADKEVELAESLGIKVYYTVTDLLREQK